MGTMFGKIYVQQRSRSYIVYIEVVMNWKKQLDSYYTQYFLGKDICIADSADRLAKVTEEMKKDFPGKYIIEEYYDAYRCRFHIRPKFETEAEKTMCYLRWE
jgi:hypothetical protein